MTSFHFGCTTGPFETTEDGFETQHGVNFFAHAYLCLRLADLLMASAPSRVMWTASEIEVVGTVDWDNLK